MKARYFCFSLILSVLVVGGYRAADLWFTKRNNAQLIDQLCSFVSERGQLGSVRNIYDQAVGVLKIYQSSSSHVQLRDGDIVYGPKHQIENSRYDRFSCQIMGWPDRSLIFYLAKASFVNLSMVISFVAVATLIFGMILLLRYFVQRISSDIKTNLAESFNHILGLALPSNNPGRLYRFFRRFLIEDNGSILNSKKTLDDLKSQLEAKIGVEAEVQSVKAKNQEFQRLYEVFIRKTRQISHDLRGPLGALRIYSGTAKDLEKNHAKIQELTSQIEQVVGDLEFYDQLGQNNMKALDILEVLLIDVVSGKRQELGAGHHCQIELKMDRACVTPVRLNAAIFKRTLRNLIQNSIEACGHGGVIEVVVNPGKTEFVNLSITDNGKGIPPYLLHQIGQYGATFGKSSGTGIGLASAREYIASLGGQLKIDSWENIGTTVTLELPVAVSEASFQGARFTTLQECLVLDDDASFAESLRIHFGINAKGFSEPIEFLIEAGSSENKIKIIDFDLKRNDFNGLKVIEALNAPQTSILATFDYLNPEVILASQKLGFPILPKALVG